MVWLHAHVSSMQATLQEAPELLHSVGVDVAVTGHNPCPRSGRFFSH
jgi:hypothetical protein